MGLFQRKKWRQIYLFKAFVSHPMGNCNREGVDEEYPLLASFLHRAVGGSMASLTDPKKPKSQKNLQEALLRLPLPSEGRQVVSGEWARLDITGVVVSDGSSCGSHCVHCKYNIRNYRAAWWLSVFLCLYMWLPLFSYFFLWLGTILCS